MEIDRLRQLIRAAVVALPVASAGCNTPQPVPPRAQPQAVVQPNPDRPCGGTPHPELPPAPPPEQAVGGTDPDFEERWERWRTSSGDRAPSGGYEILDPGRPLRGPEGPVRAGLVEGSGWVGEHSALSLTSGALRSALAEHWLEAALAEHASVASFARATLELMSVGAPPALIAAHQEASLDEIEHAKRAFGLAAAYGALRSPRALEVPGPREADLARLARDVCVEGCINETAAALVAERAARCAAIEPVRAVLLGIASDEARHAALAWATLRWTVETGGARVRDALRELPPPASTAAPSSPLADAMARHGALDAARQAAIAHESWERISAPLLAELAA